MQKIKTTVIGGAVSVALAIGGLAATATAASAEIVCNQWNECWRVHSHFNDYPPGPGIVFHDDDWRGHHMHWRHDRDDHGYYRNGVWITF
jgi:hypothetical protein